MMGRPWDIWRRLSMSLIAMVCALLNASAQTIEFDPAVVKGQLSCGLKYYIYECHRPANLTNVYLLCNVGSAVEQASQRGMAHMIEHLAYNGSKHFPGKSMVPWLESHGIEFGYDINALTSHDATIYRISNINAYYGDQLLDSCLLALRDIAADLSLDDEAVIAERQIIMEEWRQGNNASTRVNDKMFPVLFGLGSPYCNMPIGLPDDIEGCDPQALRDFYRQWYQPQFQAVIVVGSVNPKRVAKQIKKAWKGVKKPKCPTTREWTQVPDDLGLVAAAISDPEFPGSQIDLWFRIDVPPRSQRDQLAYLQDSFVGFVAKRALNERCADILYEDNSPWSNAKAELGQYYVADSKDALRLYALYDRSRRHEALERLIAEAKRAATHGITDTELRQARQQMLRLAESLPTIYDEKRNSGHYARIAPNFLKGNPVMSVERLQQAYRDFADTITAATVNAYLRQHLDLNSLTTIMVEKESGASPMPSDSTLKSLIQDIWTASSPPQWTEDTSYLRPLLPIAPTAGHTLRCDSDSVFDAVHYVLSNGARVTLCRADVHADEISLRAVQRGGESAVLDLGFADASFAPTLADLGGLGDFSATQLRKKLNGKHATIESVYAPYSEMIIGESRIDEAELLLQLLHLRMTTVRADSTAFANWQRTKLGHLLDINVDPDKVFSDSIRAALYGAAHPYLRRIQPIDIDTLHYGHALAMYRERMANPANFDYIITGCFDFDSIRPLVELYIGSLPGDGFAPQAPHHPLRRLALDGHRMIRFSQPSPSPATKVYAAFELHRDYTLIDELTIELLAAVLERVYLQTLREDAGATYTVYTGSESGEVDGFHSFYLYFETNPESAQELLDSALASLRDIAEHGIDEATFDMALTSKINDEYAATQRQSFPMAHFTHRALYGDDHYLQRAQIIDQVTPEMLQQMAQAITQAPVQVSVIMDSEQ